MLLLNITTLIGHLHPLLVHLPIGFILIAILLDVLAYRPAYAHFRPAVQTTLLLGFLAAAVSCGTGYLLSLSGDYAPQDLSLHQWGGWAVAGLSGVLYFFRAWILSTNAPRIFSALLLLLGGLLLFTGHQGGSLTHGGDYLWLQAGKDSPAKKTANLAFDSTEIELPKVNPELPLEADPTQIQKLRSLGCNVRILLKRPVMLDVTLPAQSGKSITELAPHLEALAKNIVWLNLADNGFHEKDLSVLKQMTNLEKLRLEKNPLGDGIVPVLIGLKHLEALNLNETKVSKAGVEKLKTDSGIKRVYDWKAG